MDVFPGSNLAVLGDTVTKACGVKDPTGTDDPLLRHNGKIFAKNIGHGINLVAHTITYFAFRSSSGQLRCDLLRDVYVCLGLQLDSGLARLCCQFLKVMMTISGNSFASAQPPQRLIPKLRKRCTLSHIHNLAKYLFLVDCRSARSLMRLIVHCKCVSNRRPRDFRLR